jgi:hypothetical protein
MKHFSETLVTGVVVHGYGSNASGYFLTSCSFDFGTGISDFRTGQSFLEPWRHICFQTKIAAIDFAVDGLLN